MKVRTGGHYAISDNIDALSLSMISGVTFLLHSAPSLASHRGQRSPPLVNPTLCPPTSLDKIMKKEKGKSKLSIFKTTKLRTAYLYVFQASCQKLGAFFTLTKKLFIN